MYNLFEVINLSPDLQNQKRYNLMINGKEAIKKLESLPERGKGQYVSEAILEKLNRDTVLTEAKVREICRDEIRRSSAE